MPENKDFDLSEFALASDEELKPTRFPQLDNMSAAFLFKFIPRPLKLNPAEFVFIPIEHKEKAFDEYDTKARWFSSIWYG
jgi:hypothetical protein